MPNRLKVKFEPQCQLGNARLGNLPSPTDDANGLATTQVIWLMQIVKLCITL